MRLRLPVFEKVCLNCYVVAHLNIAIVTDAWNLCLEITIKRCAKSCDLRRTVMCSTNQCIISSIDIWLQNFTLAPAMSLARTSRAISGSRDLFDHLVGATEQREWKRNAECLGSLEIDNQSDFGDLLNWQLGGFLAL